MRRDAIQNLLKVEHEAPGFDAALTLVEACRERKESAEAYRWLRQAVDLASGALEWQAAAGAFARLRRAREPDVPRRIRAAVAGSYTTAQFSSLLRVAAFREGIDLELSESRFGQYAQDLLDPASQLYAFEPAVVILAVHEGALQLPAFSEKPEADVEREFERWQRAGIWDRVLSALHAKADAVGQCDWTLHFVDGSVIRAHQHAAGARKKGTPSKPSAGVVAALAPSCMSGPSAAVNPSS